MVKYGLLKSPSQNAETAVQVLREQLSLRTRSVLRAIRRTNYSHCKRCSKAPVIVALRARRSSWCRWFTHSSWRKVAESPHRAQRTCAVPPGCPRWPSCVREAHPWAPAGTHNAHVIFNSSVEDTQRSSVRQHRGQVCSSTPEDHSYEKYIYKQPNFYSGVLDVHIRCDTMWFSFVRTIHLH